jgi:hypothetical protein
VTDRLVDEVTVRLDAEDRIGQLALAATLRRDID